MICLGRMGSSGIRCISYLYWTFDFLCPHRDLFWCSAPIENHPIPCVSSWKNHRRFPTKVSRREQSSKVKKCHSMDLPRRVSSLMQIVESLSHSINQPPAPVPQGQNNPLYEPTVTAVRTGINSIFQGLLETHNFPLPPNWTYPDFTAEVIGPEHINDLDHLVGVLRDLSLHGFASPHFHEALNFLHTIGPGFPGAG